MALVRGVGGGGYNERFLEKIRKLFSELSSKTTLYVTLHLEIFMNKKKLGGGSGLLDL